MSQSSERQSAAVADTTKLAVAPQTSQSSEESVQTVAAQPEVVQSYKTLQLLKEWPVVMYILNKGKETYASVKHSTKITETGLNVSEKVVTNLSARSGNVIQKLTPVLKVVDYSASEGVERLQKFFPIVKESPEKIYDSVVERLVKLIGPAVNAASSVTEVGRKQLKKTAKGVIKSSRKLIMLVENRLENMEKYLTVKGDTAGEPSTEAAASQDKGVASEAVASSWSGKLWRCARTSLAVSVKAPLFAVGASFWLLEKLPVVGDFFAEDPDSTPRSSQPSTSSDQSIADELTAEQPYGGQLPPQLSQATK